MKLKWEIVPRENTNEQVPWDNVTFWQRNKIAWKIKEKLARRNYTSNLDSSIGRSHAELYH